MLWVRRPQAPLKRSISSMAHPTLERCWWASQRCWLQNQILKDGKDSLPSTPCPSSLCSSCPVLPPSIFPSFHTFLSVSYMPGMQQQIRTCSLPSWGSHFCPQWAHLYPHLTDRATKASFHDLVDEGLRPSCLIPCSSFCLRGPSAGTHAGTRERVKPASKGTQSGHPRCKSDIPKRAAVGVGVRRRRTDGRVISAFGGALDMGLANILPACEVPPQTPFQEASDPNLSPHPPYMERICQEVVTANGTGRSEFKP